MGEEKSYELSCYTVGHSNHDIIDFYRLLKKHDIEKIIDVRSVPYSKHVPEYNKENLEKYLKDKGLEYDFKGESLGARHTDERFLTDSKVDFSKVRKKEDYKEEIKNIIQEIKNGKKISLMCSEKDPFDCHRFVLVSYTLKDEGIKVKHILENGDLITTGELEERLLSKYDIDPKQTTLFGDKKGREEALETAYRKRNFDISVEK